MILVAVLSAACGKDGGGGGGGGDARRRRATVDAGRAHDAAVPATVPVILPAIRGDIVDRRGVPLAESQGTTRLYPRGELAAHVVGYTTTVTAAELDRLAPLGYDADDRVGRYGIEAEWENRLRGTTAPGQRLVLTLDTALQAIAEDALAPHVAGAAVVVEVATGRILVMASKPSFDPRVMSGQPTAAEIAALRADPRKPFVDKTLSSRYPPGEIFAFVPAIAALEDGGAIDEVSLDRIAEVARQFGFGKPTGLGLNGEATGRIPTRAWYEQRGKFRIEHTQQAAAGQGDVEVTMMQVAVAYATLAGGGRRHVPQLVQLVEGKMGKGDVSYEPRLVTTVKVPRKIVDAMRGGVSGTGKVRKPSSRKTQPKDHAWFAGWAPADAPKIAIVVLLEHGADHAKIPAAIAKTIADGWAQLP